MLSKSSLRFKLLFNFLSSSLQSLCNKCMVPFGVNILSLWDQSHCLTVLNSLWIYKSLKCMIPFGIDMIPYVCCVNLSVGVIILFVMWSFLYDHTCCMSDPFIGCTIFVILCIIIWLSSQFVWHNQLLYPLIIKLCSLVSREVSWYLICRRIIVRQFCGINPERFL